MQSVPLLFSQGSRYAFLFFLCPVLYNLTIVGLYWGGCKWIHVIMSLWILLLDFTHYFLHPLFFSNLPGIRSDGSCWWNYQWPWVRLLLFHMFLGLSRFFSDVSLPQVLIYILFYLGQDIIIDYYSMSHAATSLSSLLLMIDQAHQL